MLMPNLPDPFADVPRNDWGDHVDYVIEGRELHLWHRETATLARYRGPYLLATYADVPPLSADQDRDRDSDSNPDQ